MIVLIPTHNRPKMLARVLDSIVSADQPAELEAIMVVENGSSVARELVEGYADRLPVTYVHQEAGNKSKALNALLQGLADDSRLVFFDDDIHIDPNVLTRYAEAFQRYGPGHFFGGGLRAEYETRPDPALLPYLPRSARDFDPSGGEAYKSLPDYFEFLGFNWACYRQDLKAIGDFSIHLGPGSASGARGQETDAQWRLLKNGGQAIALGHTLVDHWVPAKFVQPDWIVHRIYLSSIALGQEKASFVNSAAMLLKLKLSYLQLLFGNRGIGPRYRIAKAAGYFWGMVMELAPGRNKEKG